MPRHIAAGIAGILQRLDLVRYLRGTVIRIRLNDGVVALDPRTHHSGRGSLRLALGGIGAEAVHSVIGMLPRQPIAGCGIVVGIGHCRDHVHHVADSRPILTVRAHISLGALAEHVSTDIHAGIVQTVSGVHQEALDGLRLALIICIAVIQLPILVIPSAVGEADIVKLDLIKAHQLHGLQRQIHLVLPHIAAVHAGPVHTHDLLGIAGRGAGNHVLGMVVCHIGVVKCGDASDDVVAGILDLLHRRLILSQRIVGAGIGRGGVFLHSGGVVADSAAILNVDNKGIDAAVVGNIQIGIQLTDELHVQIQSLHLFGHHIVGKLSLLAGEIVQTGRVAAAPVIAAVHVQLVDSGIILRLSLVHRARHIAGADIALRLTGADDIADNLTLGVQLIEADDGQFLSLIH